MGNVGSIEHMNGVDRGEMRLDGEISRSTSEPIRYKSFQGGKASNPTLR